MIKRRIVIEGLKGRTGADICVDHPISQSMYYAWRDQFMSNVGLVFESKKSLVA